MIVQSERPSFFSPDHQVVLVFCIVEEHFLLLQRANGLIHEQHWTAPGGKVESNETLEEAAIRELYEETGISCDPVQLNHIGRLYIQTTHSSYTLDNYTLKLEKKPDIIIHPREHQEYRWVTLEEANVLPLIPSGDQVLDFCWRSVFD